MINFEVLLSRVPSRLAVENLTKEIWITATSAVLPLVPEISHPAGAASSHGLGSALSSSTF